MKQAKIVGQKAPLKAKNIWGLRVRREMERRVRELALWRDSAMTGRWRQTALR